MEWNRAKSPAEFAARRRQKIKSIFHRSMCVGGIILVIPREQRGPGEICNAPAQRVGETDCHISDIGHWFAMTDSQQTKNILLPIIPRAGGYLQYLFCALGGYHIDAGTAHVRDHHIPGGNGQVGQGGVQRVGHVENLFLGNFTLCADGHYGS